eukprot:4853150-Heterocapsa_arctica.AAC.1
MNDTYDHNFVNNYTDVFSTSLGHVPDDHAVLDTGWLQACAGSDTLDKFCQNFDLKTNSVPSNVQFKGVNDS